ncbi:MAG TPA: redoxin domain-containing protein [Myxococcales bacterium]|jgi:peroxiredoxin|nr:redoxin domain-containing protein [Myxococcales bacterium]
MSPWHPAAVRPGEKLPDLPLLDQAGRPATLSSLGGKGPVVVLFFGGLGDAAGLRLLCDYRDFTLSMRRAGVTVCGVGHAEPSGLWWLRRNRGVAFPLFADADATALPALGFVEQAGLLLLDSDLTVKQRVGGEHAQAEAMLPLLRRAAGKRAKPSLPERAVQFFQALHHALRPLKAAR